MKDDELIETRDIIVTYIKMEDDNKQFAFGEDEWLRSTLIPKKLVNRHQLEVGDMVRAEVSDRDDEGKPAALNRTICTRIFKVERVDWGQVEQLSRQMESIEHRVDQVERRLALKYEE